MFTILFTLLFFWGGGLLGIEPGCSGSTANVINHGAIAPVLCLPFLAMYLRICVTLSVSSTKGNFSQRACRRHTDVLLTGASCSWNTKFRERFTKTKLTISMKHKKVLFIHISCTNQSSSMLRRRTLPWLAFHNLQFFMGGLAGSLWIHSWGRLNCLDYSESREKGTSNLPNVLSDTADTMVLKCPNWNQCLGLHHPQLLVDRNFVGLTIFLLSVYILQRRKYTYHILGGVIPRS